MPQVSNREHLINGAIACLEQKGYARTTARDIAAASGANLASIGYHFGSKEALLDEALIRIMEGRNQYVAGVALKLEDASPLERLEMTFVAVRGIFEEHRPILVAFAEAMAQSERSPRLRRRMAQLYGTMRSTAADLLRTGLGPSADRLRSDPRVMASLLIAAFDGLVFQFLLEPGGTPGGEELVRSLADWMKLALEHEASSSRATTPRRSAPRGPGRASAKRVRR